MLQQWETLPRRDMPSKPTRQKRKLRPGILTKQPSSKNNIQKNKHRIWPPKQNQTSRSQARQTKVQNSISPKQKQKTASKQTKTLSLRKTSCSNITEWSYSRNRASRFASSPLSKTKETQQLSSKNNMQKFKHQIWPPKQNQTSRFLNKILNELQKWVWVVLIVPVFSLTFFASSTLEFYDLDSTTSPLGWI